RTGLYFLRKRALASELLDLARKRLRVLVRLRPVHRGSSRMESAFDRTLPGAARALLAKQFLRRARYRATRQRAMSSLTLVREVRLDHEPHRVLMRFDREDIVREHDLPPGSLSRFA